MLLAAACSVWVTMGANLFPMGRLFTVGVRCPDPAPAGFSCPAVLWEVYPSGQRDQAVHSEWEPDCSEDVAWRGPAPRTLGLETGDWEIRVTFCGAGIKARACRPGPQTVVQKKILSR
jgi:hypothetical protein